MGWCCAPAFRQLGACAATDKAGGDAAITLPMATAFHKDVSVPSTAVAFGGRWARDIVFVVPGYPVFHATACAAPFRVVWHGGLGSMTFDRLEQYQDSIGVETHGQSSKVMGCCNLWLPVAVGKLYSRSWVVRRQQSGRLKVM